MTDDQQKRADSADEGITDGKSALGSAPEDVEDIDETLQSVGLPTDEDGPRELNSQEIINRADKDQR
ncbi:hypothetical protein HYW41_05370 [Candidatus Daviesbacteria bacterium]|nr:hypothetical protein [Candidatus Daviesbacteria bacterium]